MIQPSGLRGLREATTKPTTPRAAENQTGDEPPLAFRLWCARRASGTSTTTRARIRPPATSAITDDTDRKRPAAAAVIAVRRSIQPPSWAGYYGPTVPGTLRQGRECAVSPDT